MARLHFANRYRICGTVGLLVENFSSNGKVCLNHLCQPRGQAHSASTFDRHRSPRSYDLNIDDGQSAPERASARFAMEDNPHSNVH